MRGLLRRLRNLWNQAATVTHKESGVLVTLPGQEYNVLDCSGKDIVSMLGFVDLSSLRAGDIVEIYLKMALKDQMVNRKMECKGPVAEPIIDFPRKEAVNPIVSIKQTAGVSRSIHFTWRWSKL